MSMKSSLSTILATICLVSFTACSTEHKPAPAPAPSPVAQAPAPEPVLATAGEVTVTATVAAINQKTRRVTLRDADGNETSFTAGDEVRNLKQVHKGDKVSATYYESLAVSVLKPGEAEPGITQTTDTARARPGDKPGIAGAQMTTITATVTAIDKKKQTV